MKRKKQLSMGLVIKYETLIASAIIIVSVFVLSLFLLLPNILKVDQISKEKGILADKINRLSNKRNLLAEYNYDIKKQDFEKMQHILPSTADYISVIQTIDNLEVKSGVSILKTDFKSPSKNLGAIASPSASFIWVSLSLEGRYDQLEAFLKGLNALDGRLFHIYQSSYTQVTPEKSTLDIISVVYYTPVNLKLETLDAVLPPIGENRQRIIDSISAEAQTAPTESTGDAQLGKPDLFN